MVSTTLEISQMTSHKKTIRATFFQVKSDRMKQEKLVEIAEEHFEKKEPFLFKVPHQKGCDYLDLLLWRFPQESFLPHSVTNSPTDDLLVIASSDQNPNRARGIFNLTGQAIANTDLFFSHIYEFEDLTAPEKNRIAQDHYKTYKEQGYNIITL